MKEVLTTIRQIDNIAILTHENPDGDAIGSSLALYLSLKELGKKVDLILPEYPKLFSYLKELNQSISDSNKKYNLTITVDCASFARINEISNIFNNSNKTMVIDHHASNDKYGDINLIDENSSSCSQIIFKVIRELNVDINKSIGNSIITGMLTDTGGFKHSNVTSETFDIASYLYKHGTEISKVYTALMQTKSMAQFELYKMVINRLELFENGKIAFSYISKEDMANVGAVFGDHEGLVDIGKGIDGVSVSIFLREEEGYKISLRSNNEVDVSKIAKHFSGGGHRQAAGCNIHLAFLEAKNAIINEVKINL